jgi:putative restriction endonuclease
MTDPARKSDADLIEAMRSLNVFARGERRAPHKPLLLLLVLGRLQAGESSALSFPEATALLRPLLERYAPPVKGHHQPELPYWYLQSDGLWEIEGASALPRQKGGFPLLAALRESSGQLPAPVEAALRGSTTLIEDCAKLLLDRHFPETVHDSIAASVGLVLGDPGETSRIGRRRRDPSFRVRVLDAYEHRCALTGFRAALDGSYFGVEAAHVRAHCWDGPDEVANGLVLTPTLHRLYDFGAWSLTDDRRVLVSAKFTGTSEATSMLRSLHGSALHAPLPGYAPVRADFIRWHREPEHGGVFRQPALPL